MASEKLIIIAKIIAKPGKTELVKESLIKLIKPTRAEEGCEVYDLQQDNQDPNTFLFYEVWQNKKMWEAHMKMPHLKQNSEETEGAIEEFIVNQMTQVLA